MTAIPLGRELLHGSSFLPARSASSINACLFGIAPSGGYRVSPFVTQGAAFALPGPKDSSLWPCSAPHGGRPLAVTLLCGVRTFLPPSRDGRRLSGLLHPLFYRSAAHHATITGRSRPILLPGGGACDIANAWPCRCVQPNGTTLHFPSLTRRDFVIDACAHLTCIPKESFHACLDHRRNGIRSCYSATTEPVNQPPANRTGMPPPMTVQAEEFRSGRVRAAETER
jgi:hypothetical protein